jgi:hypothetical protein
VDVDERSLVHRLFELAGELAAHVRELAAATGCDLLFDCEVPGRFVDCSALPPHLTKNGLVPLETLLRVFGGDGDRLPIREAPTVR